MSRRTNRNRKKSTMAQKRCDFLGIDLKMPPGLRRETLRKIIGSHTWPGYLAANKLKETWEKYKAERAKPTQQQAA